MKVVGLALSVLLFAQVSFSEKAAPVQVVRHGEKVSQRGERVEKFTLSNAYGLKVTISTLGASITSLYAPDIHGKVSDVVLGFSDHDNDAHKDGSPYFGCIVGRVANRIAHGKFEIDGKEYKLDCNNGPNHLHGGKEGFDKRVWVPQLLDDGIQLNLTSPDGDQGYPGNVSVTAEYRLVNDAIELRMRATSDAPTPINLAQHSYFNLAGHDSGTILGHELQMSSDSYTPTDENSIPTREVLASTGTAFDFSQPRIIGEAMAAMAAERGLQLRYDPAKSALVSASGGGGSGIAPTAPGGSQSPSPLGFDHNFVITGACDGPPPSAAAAAAAAAPKKAAAAAAAAAKKSAKTVRHVATVRESASGRILTVESDAPGVQFYTGNYLGPATAGKAGYPQHAGFCLETQHFPDSVGLAASAAAAAAAAASADAAAAADAAGAGAAGAPFARGATPIIRPGDVYTHTVVYRFSTRPWPGVATQAPQ